MKEKRVHGGITFMELTETVYVWRFYTAQYMRFKQTLSEGE